MTQRDGDLISINASGAGWRSSGWSRIFLPACLAVYIALGTAYVFVLPLGQAPDEPAHFQYILFIAEHGRLAHFYDDDAGYEAYQAPLYYTLGAAAGKLAMIGAPDDPAVPPTPARDSDDQIIARLPDYPTVREGQHELALDALRQSYDFTIAARQAWIVVRLLTVAIGAIGVFLGYRIIFLLFPDHPWIAATVAGFMATLPMYVHISASASNDPPTVAAVGFTLLISLLILRHGPTVRRCAMLGLALGIGMLTKDSANAAVPVALLALTWSIGLRHEPKPTETILTGLGARAAALDWPLLLKRLGVVFGVAAVVAGWWYGRNIALYGSPVHFPANVERQIPWETYLGYPEMIVQVLSIALPMFFRNFWAGFAWTNIAVAPWMYTGFLVIAVAALPGLLGFIFDARAGRLQWSKFQVRGFWLLILGLVLLGLAVLWYILLIDLGGGSQGRYLFPVLPVTTMLWALGVGRLLPRRAHRAIPLVVTGAMLAFNLYCLLGVIAPFYQALGI